MKYLRALTNININFISSKPKQDFFDSLQNAIIDKKQYYNSSLNSLNNLLNCLKDFNMRVNNLSKNIDLETISNDEKKMNFLIKKIFNKVSSKFEESINFLEEINSHILKYIKNLTEEISIYKEYNEINNKLIKEKIKFKESEKTYHESGKEMEYRLIQFITNNIHNLNHIYQNEFLMEDLDHIIYPAEFTNQEYLQNLSNINETIENFNLKQAKFYNFLQEILANDEVLYYNVIKTFVNSLENEDKNLHKEIKEMKDTKNIEKNEKNEFKELVENAEKDKIEEEKIKIENYPTKLDFNNCKTKIEFEIYFECIKIIKKYVNKKIFPDYNYDIELKNYKMLEIIKNLFKQKEKINKSLSDSFLDLIEYPSVHHTFFIILSKLRSSGTFAQNNFVISLLGKGFNIILKNAKKNKSYDDVKNIIILSETYYYENEKKEKIYLFEFIKNNKWLKSANFWRDFIQDSINKDLQRFDNSFNKNCIKNKNKIEINLEKKLNEIVFSQLLTYSNNMKNFEIDKRIIVKIMDEFIEKYKYVSQSNIKTIFDMIISSENDGEKNNEDIINKLRKEYDISLEKENNDIDKDYDNYNDIIENKNEKDEIKDRAEDKKEDKIEEEEVKDDDNNIENIKENIDDNINKNNDKNKDISENNINNEEK